MAASFYLAILFTQPVNEPINAMIKLLILPISIWLFSLSAPTDPNPEIDTFWETMSQTVAEGDFEGYAALYHEDAVLVNGISEESYPIADALAGWKQGFVDTKNGKMTAGVKFRFSKRMHSENTAHDTGMFLYVAQKEGEAPQGAPVHFQALLVKKDGEWKMMMEYQVSIGTQEEWDALK